MEGLLFVKLINKTGRMPWKSTDEAAGYDLYSTEEKTLQPFETYKFGLGIALQMPKWEQC